MLVRIFRRLENPAQPLLGPNIYWLKFWGLILPRNLFGKYFYLFLHGTVFTFVITEYMDIWFIRSNINQLLNNIKVSMISAVSVTKVVTILIWQKQWKDVSNYATRADKKHRSTPDPNMRFIIDKYTLYCRRVTYGYWILVFITVVALCVQPLIKYASSSAYRENIRNGTDTYPQMLSSWVPYDKTTPWGSTVTFAFHAYVTFYAGGWITSFDTNSIVLMVFFGGQLELLKCKCAMIFGTVDEVISEVEARRRLIECHNTYVELLKYSKLFNSLLSPIMLLYMFVCSVMICASAYQIANEASTMQRFLAGEYLVFGVAQLFNYCWHGNQVYYSSLNLFRGPLESRWWSYKTRFGRDLAILSGQLNKNIVFTAGPFVTLTLPCFVSILRGAYSYYTLLKKG